jgi:protein-S-isoprenylcysteine O-methyltransferase Ste14
MTSLDGTSSSRLPLDHLQRVQKTRKSWLRGLLGLTLVLAVFVDSYWYPRAPVLYHAIEWMGVVLISTCIAGRTWCSLYIGGRKKRELVTAGPYSLVRNPLYVFTLIGSVGLGAQSGSLVIAAWFGLVAFVIFRGVVRSEERFLAREFPAEFRAYALRVPRFWPRFAAWQDIDELTIKPELMLRTFGQASLFLISIPAADILETLQRHGVIPVLMLLP